MSDDTELVRVTVLGLDRVASAGRLLALASVEIEIAGVAFTLHGVRVVRFGPKGRAVESPVYRDHFGRSAVAVGLPPELSRAVAVAVLDAHRHELAIAPSKPIS